MPLTKDQILDEYKKLKASLGAAPDSKTFYEKTPVSKYALEAAFGGRAYSKLQKAAGDEPRTFTSPGRSHAEFFETYGTCVRELQALPTEAEWRHRKIQPTVSGYCKKLNLRWSEMPGRFREWASDKPEWKDVVHICVSQSASKPRGAKQKTLAVRGYVYLAKSGIHFKIGKTNAVGRREYELRLQLPERVKTIHVIKTDDPAGIEAYWHKRFEAKRKQGEWFQLSKDDIDAFKSRESM